MLSKSRKTSFDKRFIISAPVVLKGEEFWVKTRAEALPREFP